MSVCSFSWGPRRPVVQLGSQSWKRLRHLNLPLRARLALRPERPLIAPRGDTAWASSVVSSNARAEPAIPIGSNGFQWRPDGSPPVYQLIPDRSRRSAGVGCVVAQDPTKNLARFRFRDLIDEDDPANLLIGGDLPGYERDDRLFGDFLTRRDVDKSNRDLSGLHVGQTDHCGVSHHRVGQKQCLKLGRGTWKPLYVMSSFRSPMTAIAPTAVPAAPSRAVSRNMEAVTRIVAPESTS